MIFLTKEEKIAIKILKDWKNYNIKNKNKLLEIDKTINIRETILNLIEKLKKENKRYKSENETLKCSIAVANKLEERIKEKFISKEKIEEWRKSKDKSLMWSNADDLYYFNKWTKELLESEE